MKNNVFDIDYKPNQVFQDHKENLGLANEYFHTGQFEKLYEIYLKEMEILPKVLIYHLENKKPFNESCIFDYMFDQQIMKKLFDLISLKKLPMSFLEIEENYYFNNYSKDEINYYISLLIKLNIIEIDTKQQIIISIDEKFKWKIIEDAPYIFEFQYGPKWIYMAYFLKNLKFGFSESRLILRTIKKDYFDIKNFKEHGTASSGIHICKNLIKNIDKTPISVTYNEIIDILNDSLNRSYNYENEAELYKLLGKVHLDKNNEIMAFEHFKKALDIDSDIGVRREYQKLKKNFEVEKHANLEYINPNVTFKQINLEKGDSDKFGEKSVFFYDDSKLVAEEVAVNFYKKLGYNAIWSENNYWKMLSALLFWNIFNHKIENYSFYIYLNMGLKHSKIFYKNMPKPNFKSYSIDILFECMYSNINKIFNEMNEENQYQKVKESYKSNYGKEFYKYTILDDWDEFSLNELLIAPKYMKFKFIPFLKKLINNYSQFHKGMPDLIVYDDNEFFFVEVKTKNDKIMSNQLKWHEFIATELDMKIELFFINKTDSQIKNFRKQYVNWKNY